MDDLGLHAYLSSLVDTQPVNEGARSGLAAAPTLAVSAALGTASAHADTVANLVNVTVRPGYQFANAASTTPARAPTQSWPADKEVARKLLLQALTDSSWIRSRATSTRATTTKPPI
jgi:phage-related protein